MDSVGGIIAAVLIAIVLLGAAGVTQYALADGGTEQVYEETFDPGENETLVVLNQSQQDDVYYSSSVTVTDENESLMRADSDYQWNQDNGTLTVLDGGRLDGDAEGTIEYSVSVPTAQQDEYATLIGGWLNATYMFPLVLIVALVVVSIGALSGLS